MTLSTQIKELRCGDGMDGKGRYHSACLRRLFGTPALPCVELSHGDVLANAQEMAGRMSISGVQPKLSTMLESRFRNSHSMMADQVHRSRLSSAMQETVRLVLAERRQRLFAP